MFQYSSGSLFSHWPAPLKIAIAFAVSIAALAFREPQMQAGVFAFIFSMLLFSGYRSFPRLFLSLAPVILVTDAAFLLLLSDYVDVWFLLAAANLRILSVFSAFAFLSFTTDLFEIPKLLRRLRFPESLCLAFYTMLRFLPEMEREFREVLHVQRLKGISIKKPLHFLRGIFVPLVFIILERSDELAIAYHLRQQRPKKTA